MEKTVHTISISLLQENKQPKDSVREDIPKPEVWDKLEDHGALIVLDRIKGRALPWAGLIEAPEAFAFTESSPYALVFVPFSGRWLVITFGRGHFKLDPDTLVQDFGLRVVLNTVHPAKLRSADIRKLDENITTRRTQTVRRCDQTAFGIDIERDIMRGLAGEPSNRNFAKSISGSDVLRLTKKMNLYDFPGVCEDAFKAFGQEDYKENFAWIDQINHVRDTKTIKELEAQLVKTLNGCLKPSIPNVFAGCLTKAIPNTLNLAYPSIYDPDTAQLIRYMGFSCSNIHTDLEIEGYIADMRGKDVTKYDTSFLTGHKVCNVDPEGKANGACWRVRDCLVFETYLNDEKYIFSAGRWYRIETSLAKQISEFFAGIDFFRLPPATADETEEQYNKRVGQGDHDMLLLDRKLVRPTGASNSIEACDLLRKDAAMIHVKDWKGSSTLSHLLNQGTVSARVMKDDGTFRDRLKARIREQEAEFRVNGYASLVAARNETYSPKSHLIIYAVMSPRERLPFFSLVTFRQAVKELEKQEYRCAFAWIYKPASTKTKAKGEGKTQTEGLIEIGSVEKSTPTAKKSPRKGRTMVNNLSKAASVVKSTRAAGGGRRNPMYQGNRASNLVSNQRVNYPAPNARALKPETLITQMLNTSKPHIIPKAQMTPLQNKMIQGPI